jgi:hypothetical protein
MNTKTILIISFLLALNLFSCKTQDLGQPEPLPNYEQQIEQWQHDRRASLSEPNGWLGLVGLHWLEEGENKCGSGADNQVILPRTAPEYVGVYTLNEGSVSCSVIEQEGLSSTSGNRFCGIEKDSNSASSHCCALISYNNVREAFVISVTCDLPFVSFQTRYVSIVPNNKFP